MKTINISSEQLKDALERLWDTCIKNGSTLHLDPTIKKIFVHNASHESIATINVIDITDEYDISSEVFTGLQTPNCRG